MLNNLTLFYAVILACGEFADSDLVILPYKVV